MTPTSILESALYVTNLTAAEDFYGSVLGLEQISKVDGRHIFYRCGSGVLLLFNASATKIPPAPETKLPVPPHGTTGAGHLAFGATPAELDRWKSYLEAHGVDIEATVEWPQGGRSIYFRDPSGNSLEFAEPKIWGL
jgi:catechol 2,3-dioxygenase-like lactoylglutathione lyase family enzyme